MRKRMRLRQEPVARLRLRLGIGLRQRSLSLCLCGPGLRSRTRSAAAALSHGDPVSHDACDGARAAPCDYAQEGQTLTQPGYSHPSSHGCMRVSLL